MTKKKIVKAEVPVAAVVAEPVKAKTAPKKRDMTRIESLHQAVMAAKGQIDLKELPLKADRIYAATGKTSNEKESKWNCGYFVKTLLAFDFAKIENGSLILKF